MFPKTADNKKVRVTNRLLSGHTFAKDTMKRLSIIADDNYDSCSCTEDLPQILILNAAMENIKIFYICPKPKE